MLRSLIKYTSRSLKHQKNKCKPLSQTPDVDDKRFLFICGLHRSGTSILHRLLREHPLTSGFHDLGVAQDEGQHLQSVFPAAHVFGGAGEFAFNPDAHLTETSELASAENRDVLLREWGAYYDLDKQILLEKSPPNLIRSRFFRSMLPNSSFVFIVRHPVAVSLATEKWTSRSIIERLLHWHTAHAIMLNDIRSLENSLVIRYEDFINTPLKYLDDICQMMSIPGFAPEEQIENHNSKYFSQWQKHYTSELSTLQAIMPASCVTLDHFGYTLDNPFVKF